MAAAYRASAGAAASLTVTIPAAVQAGDLLLLAVTVHNTTDTINTPSGWTKFGSYNGGSVNFLDVFTRTAVAGDAGSVLTVTSGSTVSAHSIAVAAYSGIASSGIVASGSAVDSSGAATVTGPTVAFTGRVLPVHIGSGASNGSGSTSLAVNATTTRQSFGTTGAAGNNLLVVGDDAVSGTSPTAARTVTMSPNYTLSLAIVSLALAEQPFTAPASPTLGAPVGGVYTDLAANGGPFTWTYSNGDGTTQQAYAFRRKISGAAAYEYWNASTGAFQSTEVYNTSSSGSLTFAAGKWTDGNTYQWSVNTQSTASLTGTYAADATVNASGPPAVTVTAPTGTQVTQTPTVTWTTTVQTGLSEAQTAYRVIVESGAFGTVPGSGTVAWDSTTVSSAAMSVTVGTALANMTTYRAFVQVTETGGQSSGWGYTGFTVTLDSTATPAVSAVWDPTAARALVTVQGRDNLLTVDGGSFEGSTGGWTAGANTTVARSTAQALDGAASLSLTSTAAGAMSASSATGTAGVPVVAGNTYTALASLRPGSTAQTFTVAAQWYSAAGTLLSTSTSPAATETTGAWAQAAGSTTAPAGAAFAAALVTVTTTTAAAEVHYLDAVSIAPGTSTTWTRGGLTGLTTATVEKSLDSGVTWQGVRTALPGQLPLPSPSQTVTVPDYEITPGTTVLYRAKAQAIA